MPETSFRLFNGASFSILKIVQQNKKKASENETSRGEQNQQNQQNGCKPNFIQHHQGYVQSNPHLNVPQMVPQQMVTQQMVPQQMVPQQMLQQQMVTQQMVPQQHLFQVPPPQPMSFGLPLGIKHWNYVYYPFNLSPFLWTSPPTRGWSSQEQRRPGLGEKNNNFDDCDNTVNKWKYPT